MNPLTTGGLILIAILSLACTVLWKTAGYERGKRADAEAQMASWRATAEECSKATQKAKEEADKRARIAQDALKKARQGSAKAQTEQGRLKAELGKRPQTTCPAGEAVAAVREGLK